MKREIFSDPYTLQSPKALSSGSQPGVRVPPGVREKSEGVS
jgi:hypothetical protein